MESILKNMKNRKFTQLLLLSASVLLLLFLQSSFAKINKTDQKRTTHNSFVKTAPEFALSNADKNIKADKNLILKSTDGGTTWQDISNTAPVMDQSALYYAGATGFYVQAKNALYSTNDYSQKMAWTKENIPGFVNQQPIPPTMIAFNNSGTVAFNYDGSMYTKQNGTNNWRPLYANFKRNALRNVFETSGGVVFLSYDNGLYRSTDKGKSWQQVEKGRVINIAESGGVLIATGSDGIIRSTDNGKSWNLIINDGGAGIDVAPYTGGFLAISYDTAANSRRIRISKDYGETWQLIDKGLNPSPHIKYIIQIGNYLICGHPDGVLRSADEGKTWQLIYPGIAEKVFSVYSSGTVLYAVAGIPGC